MKKIKWGIIGLGNIANKFAQTVMKMEYAKLVAVSSRSIEKSKAFGAKYDVIEEKCYDNYLDLIHDDDIDAVYIAVPNSLHKELSILALNNGKAVLCEKPVMLNGEEIREVVSIAKEKNIFFMEAMKTRFLPIIRFVKSEIEKGKIGDIKLIQADFGFNAPYDPKDKLYCKELGGGSLYDVGIYNLSFASYFLGNSPIKISSEMGLTESGVDRWNSITLGYEGGAVAQLYSSLEINTVRNGNIIGTKGRIVINRYSNADTAIIITDNGEEKVHLPFEINGFEYQIEEVIKCLNKGKIESDIMSWRDSIEIIDLMDKVRNEFK